MERQEQGHRIGGPQNRRDYAGKWGELRAMRTRNLRPNVLGGLLVVRCLRPLTPSDAEFLRTLGIETDCRDLGNVPDWAVTEQEIAELKSLGHLPGHQAE